MFVRIAIAHAIPYEHIINDLLPNLGMSGVRATGPITPELGYFYNTKLAPFEYDLDLAEKFLDMWKYSLPEYAPYGSPQVDLGPLGDGDFDGYVDTDDYVVWADRLVYNEPEPWQWPFPPPIDPDWDNNGFAEGADFFKWRAHIGDTYP